ncbi:MAG: hypothetical protein EAZ30_12785 [Betaproteobacteria bacterium]|nr:MAG: hypothetical protein EAZ30_12785 [Betaproteobacteria bacterium]
MRYDERMIALRRFFGAPVFAALSLTLSSCAVVRTGADVASAGVSAVGTVVTTTASVAKTGAEIGLKSASTAASVGTATVGAASAAKTVSVATANTAIAGAALVGGGVATAVALSRGAEISHTNVVANAGDSFSAQDGRELHTQGCETMIVGQPGVLVVERDGTHEIRVSGRGSCKVVRIKHAN